MSLTELKKTHSNIGGFKPFIRLIPAFVIRDFRLLSNGKVYIAFTDEYRLQITPKTISFSSSPEVDDMQGVYFSNEIKASYPRVDNDSLAIFKEMLLIPFVALLFPINGNQIVVGSPEAPLRFKFRAAISEDFSENSYEITLENESPESFLENQVL